VRRTATWPGTGVHTVRELQRRHRRLNRRVQSATFVISCMRAGATLHLTFRNGGRKSQPEWMLSDGQRISSEVARLVINDHRVVSVGDSLFQGMTGQTYRYVEL
jgi:hypothetical protein